MTLLPFFTTAGLIEVEKLISNTKGAKWLTSEKSAKFAVEQGAIASEDLTNSKEALHQLKQMSQDQQKNGMNTILMIGKNV